MTTQEIKKILDSEAGQAMKDFLIEELKELRNIDGLKDYKTATAQALELKSHKKAYDKLRAILERLMTINETETEKSERDSYYSI